MSTEEILSGLPLWATLPNTSGTGSGTFPQWDGTKWVAVTISGGGFDLADNYNPTGFWYFSQTPQVLGVTIATRDDLSNYATIEVVENGLMAKADASALTAYATTTALTYGLATKADASALAAYATTNALSSGLAGKADASALANYATTSALASGLATKADASALSGYVSKTGNETINDIKLFADTINANNGLSMRYATAPAGTASRTTLFADATGRLSWRNGTGFTRTFDAGSITANRNWTMPNADTTLAGLSVQQTFTAQQIFTSGTFTAGNSFFGNNTAIINSVGQAGFGVNGSLTAQLTARGDGTDPIARFENSTGSNAILFDTTGTRITTNQAASSRITFGTGALSLSGGWGGASGFSVVIDNAVGGSFTGSVAGAVQGLLNVTGTFASATSSGNAIFRPININYTINNSASQTGTATGIFLNATETALNGMVHNFIDCQVNGVSNFLVNRIGQINTVGSINTSSNMQIGSAGQFIFSGRSRIYSDANSNIRLSNNAGTDFDRLQFGGTSNLFPSIKRNGADLEVRLADDSARGNLLVGQLYSNSLATFGANATVAGNLAVISPGVFGGSIASIVPSAILQADSTIRGFLPPRMTTAQKNAISSPARGLVVFDTDLNKMCVFVAVWETITSVGG